MAQRWSRPRRRRRWTRELVRVGLPLVVAAVVVGFIVGALAEIGPASGPYRRTVDRGFATLAGSVAVQSDATGAALDIFLSKAPSLQRSAFFTDLDGVATDAASDQQRLDSAVPPAPAGDSDVGCLSALAGRASASATVRQALQGLLGGTTGTTPLASTAVLSDIEAAARELAQSDAAWASCQRSLRKAPGRPRLSRSVWLTHPVSWTPASLLALVNAVTASSTLAAALALSITTVVTDPAFLPGPAGPVVSPTHQLTVHAVVSNVGNVDEPTVEVSVLLSGSPASSSASERVALVAGQSMSVELGPLAVAPGGSYTLLITAGTPTGVGSAASRSTVEVVASPTTTTTTTTTVPRRRSAASPVSGGAG